MTRELDTAGWPRRQTYELFRDYAHPYFNVCVALDLAPLEAALRAAPLPGGGLTLACHWLVLALAHRVEPFRYRFEGDRVVLHDTVHGSTTVLRDDDSIGFAHLPWNPDPRAFVADVAPRLAAVRSGHDPFDARADESAVLHFTTLPWLHFSHFSFARSGRAGDAVPKFAFGQRRRHGAALRMPLALEVHHALMDGLHAGRFVQGLEAALAEPSGWLGGGWA